jgi:hypothetical protein
LFCCRSHKHVPASSEPEGAALTRVPHGNQV